MGTGKKESKMKTLVFMELILFWILCSFPGMDDNGKKKNLEIQSIIFSSGTVHFASQVCSARDKQYPC